MSLKITLVVASSLAYVVEAGEEVPGGVHGAQNPCEAQIEHALKKHSHEVSVSQLFIRRQHNQTVATDNDDQHTRQNLDKKCDFYFFHQQKPSSHSEAESVNDFQGSQRISKINSKRMELTQTCGSVSKVS